MLSAFNQSQEALSLIYFGLNFMLVEVFTCLLRNAKSLHTNIHTKFQHYTIQERRGLRSSVTICYGREREGSKSKNFPKVSTQSKNELLSETVINFV